MNDLYYTISFQGSMISLKYLRLKISTGFCSDSSEKNLKSEVSIGSSLNQPKSNPVWRVWSLLYIDIFQKTEELEDP